MTHIGECVARLSVSDARVGGHQLEEDCVYEGGGRGVQQVGTSNIQHKMLLLSGSLTRV